MLTKRTLCLTLVFCLLLSLPLMTAAAPLPSQGQPPQPGEVKSDSPDIQAMSPDAITAIVPVVTVTGRVSWSIDGLGTNSAGGGIIQVEKPAGATVKSAYLAAATIYNGGTIANGAIQVDGIGVNWDSVISNSIHSYNHWSDVTSLVKPKIDAAPAGRLDFTITEANTGVIDGEILAVIFDDPSQLANNTIVLLFGAQNTTGDTFAIRLADPLDLTDPNLALIMSLGISYGYQSSANADQYSLVDVNGQRLTTSAGGQDDAGYLGPNGTLLTVGGLDDSIANPPDPYSGTQGSPPYRYDDELYDLKPFVQNGDTTIQVDTLNPSNDDNVFFAALLLASTQAVVNEGILLSPIEATNPVGTEHTVTARVQDDLGAPLQGVPVTFTILSGPNAGASGACAVNADCTTDATGQVSFTYTGAGGAGVDEIQACFINRNQQQICSQIVTKTWTGAGAQIYGYIYLDGNADGWRQIAETTGVFPVTVMLSKEGVPVDTAVSIATDGWYQFPALEAGNYCVEIVMPPAYVPTSPTKVCFTLEADKHVDFGLVPARASIGDTVFLDVNFNGVQDLGEPGIPLVTVALWTAVGGAPGAVVGNTITDANGNYLFDPVVPGDYFVQVTDANGELAGLTLTTAGNPLGPLTVVHEQVYLDADFGYNLICPSSRGTIAGRVWHDGNGDGVQDAGEAGIKGVAVCAEPMGYVSTRCSRTNTLGFFWMCVPKHTYLVAPDWGSAALAGLAPTTREFYLPVVIQPGGAFLTAFFGYW